MRRTDRRPTDADGRSALSFIGGLVFFSVVVGFTISQNKRLREEIGKQIQSILEVSLDIVQQARQLVVRLDGISRLVKAAKPDEPVLDNLTQPSQAADKGDVTGRQLAKGLQEYELFWDGLDEGDRRRSN